MPHLYGLFGQICYVKETFFLLRTILSLPLNEFLQSEITQKSSSPLQDTRVTQFLKRKSRAVRTYIFHLDLLFK